MTEPNPTPAGAQMDVDLSAPTVLQANLPTAASKSWQESVPVAYRDKPYIAELAKQANPIDELYKQFDNQQSLIGRKDLGLQVPGEQATEQEWKDFHVKLGAHDSADKYTYTPPTAPPGLEQQFATDDKLLATMRAAALEGGLTQRQWEKVVKSFDSYYGEALQARHTEAQNYLKTLADNFTKNYGAKSTEVMGAFEKAASSTPDFAKAWIQSQEPEGKAAMAALFHNFATKYVGEDKLDFSNMSGSAAGAGMSPTQYGDEYEKRFATMRQAEKAYGVHSGDYLRAKKELAELQATGAKIFAKA